MQIYFHRYVVPRSSSNTKANLILIVDLAASLNIVTDSSCSLTEIHILELRGVFLATAQDDVGIRSSDLDSDGSC